jgi:hypothetical protein
MIARPAARVDLLDKRRSSYADKLQRNPCSRAKDSLIRFVEFPVFASRDFDAQSSGIPRFAMSQTPESELEKSSIPCKFTANREISVETRSLWTASRTTQS